MEQTKAQRKAAYNKAYREANRELILRRSKEYKIREKAKDPEAYRARLRAARKRYEFKDYEAFLLNRRRRNKERKANLTEEEREKLRAAEREYWRLNPQRKQANARRYREKHREMLRLRSMAFYRDNRDSILLRQREQRARCADGYMAKAMRVRRKDVSPEVCEAKRSIMMVKRLLKGQAFLTESA